MKKRDYYEVLGVDRGADDEELKRAFREQARKFHPDLNQDDDRAERLFKEINEAYAVLTDPKLRSRYDRFGHAGLDEENLSGVTMVMETLDDLFGDIGRKWRERFKRRRGKDLRYTLEIDFTDATHGCEREIEIENNRGHSKKFTVRIPAGTKTGAVEMIRGEGEPGVSGGPAGDLAVVIRVRPDQELTRDGHNILSDTLISYVQAVLGDTIEVSTVDGPVRMKVPPGTSSGRVFRIRGRGVPKSSLPKAPRGDHLVTVHIEVPESVTPKQEELLRAYAAEDAGHDLANKKPGFVGKLRSLLDD